MVIKKFFAIRLSGECRKQSCFPFVSNEKRIYIVLYVEVYTRTHIDMTTQRKRHMKLVQGSSKGRHQTHCSSNNVHKYIPTNVC